MELLSVIRRWRLRAHFSIREISRRTGLPRNTVRKYLRSDMVEDASIGSGSGPQPVRDHLLNPPRPVALEADRADGENDSKREIAQGSISAHSVSPRLSQSK